MYGYAVHLKIFLFIFFALNTYRFSVFAIFTFMNGQMFPHITCNGKCFTTYGAHMISLSIMNPHMNFQVSRLCEAFIAQMTSVWFQSKMNISMVSELGI